ncbi:MAG: type II secretion system GspH family protein [Candidatus Marinimicrobia bacterium]|nr:type II secretion system GspH family protein [Candidatus Neomarinimicrobiota bacterium]
MCAARQAPVPHRRPGFTLVELLVVIAILGFLMALIFPNLRKALQSARTIQCASNLRQYGMALTQYGQENKGMFPPKAVPGLFNSVFTWTGKAGEVSPYDRLTADLRHLNPYVNVYQPDDPCLVARCPSDEGTVLYHRSGSAYGSNTNPLMPNSVVDKSGRSIAFIRVRLPSLFVVLADHGANSMVWGLYSTSWHRTEQGRQYWNLLFADGHAQLLPVDHNRLKGESYSYCYE